MSTPGHAEPWTLDREQADDRHADRVGAAWRAGREEAALHDVEVGGDAEPEILGRGVERVDEVDALEPVEIGEPLLEGGVELDGALHVVEGALGRGAGPARERRPDHADGPEDELLVRHGFSSRSFRGAAPPAARRRRTA
jgi:hypothetical protein